MAILWIIIFEIFLSQEKKFWPGLSLAKRSYQKSEGLKDTKKQKDSYQKKIFKKVYFISNQFGLTIEKT